MYRRSGCLFFGTFRDALLIFASGTLRRVGGASMPSATTTAAAQAARAKFGPPTHYQQIPTGGTGLAFAQSSKPRPANAADGGVKGVTLKAPAGAPPPPRPPTPSQYAGEASSVEHQKIDNLKQQVELLESELRTYREGHLNALPAAAAAAVAVVPAAAAPKASAAVQAPSSKELQVLEARNDELRKEALSAKLRERRAVEEMAEAKELLTEQRAKFTATRKELTAEVIEYQREIDEVTTAKRALEADLADLKAALHEREEFVHGYVGWLLMASDGL